MIRQYSSLQAIYGGTFDPIHYGHLRSVEILADIIGLHRVFIMPNNVPPYRQQPLANNKQRKKMLELAINNRLLFKLDEHELKRNAPSYTYQTLQEWRDKWWPQKPLAFIIGQDSLFTFPTWHNYETILDNSHLIVCQRAGYTFKMLSMKYRRWLEKYLTYDINDLYKLPSGKIFLSKIPFYFNVSATIIRQRLKQGLSCEGMLPPHVLNYILQQKIYQKA